MPALAPLLSPQKSFSQPVIRLLRNCWPSDRRGSLPHRRESRQLIRAAIRSEEEGDRQKKCGNKRLESESFLQSVLETTIVRTSHSSRSPRWARLIWRAVAALSGSDSVWMRLVPFAGPKKIADILYAIVIAPSDDFSAIVDAAGNLKCPARCCRDQGVQILHTVSFVPDEGSLSIR